MSKANNWKNAAYNNLPLFKELIKGHHLIPPLRIFDKTYRERKNLWILAAGMLDAARYMNVTRMGLPDLHEGFDGNATERSIWQELWWFIDMQHEDEFQKFLDMYSVSTDNFVDTDNIKTVLYNIVFNRPGFANTDNPVVLLAAAVAESRYIKPASV